MAPHLNVPINIVRLSRDITRLGGSDRYETIGYRIVNGPDGAILKLRVQPSLHGPPFLALGIDVTNTSGTNLQLAGTRLTMYDVLGFGVGGPVRPSPRFGIRGSR